MKNTLRFTLIMALMVWAGSLAACTENSAASKDEKPAGVLTALQSTPAKVTIPEGTRLRIALIDGVGTATSSRGDQFTASLSAPVIVDGKMVLDKGTKVRGRVADVNESGRVKGRASIQMILTDIVRDGNNVPIATKPFTAVAEETKKRDTEIIAGGAGVGALVGAIAGGKKGAGLGALIGGGAGTGTVLATKGKELHYPPETQLSFTLASAVEI